MESRTDTKQIRKLWEVIDKKNSAKSFYSFNQEKPNKSLNDDAKGALKNAKEAAILSLPLITKAGIDIFTAPKGGYIDFSGVGLVIAVGGIVIDTIKAPFFLAAATEEATRAGITKVASLLFEGSPIHEQEKRIFKSFLIRFRETASLLISLGLEDKDVLNTKLANGDIEDLIALTLLHTAYASRRYKNGLVLANENVLQREFCPEHSLVLFDKVMDLKNTINEALKLANINSSLSEVERQLEESRIVLQWIKLIKEGKFIVIDDKKDATLDQIMVVNAIIEKINHLKLIAIAQLSDQSEQKIQQLKI
jgi:hypothetical protein